MVGKRGGGGKEPKERILLMAETFEGSLSGVFESVNALAKLLRTAGAKNMIADVIFNDPATIVVWTDGAKTVVRCQEGDAYDKRTGLLLCIAKRSFGNGGVYNDVLNRYAPEEPLCAK